MKKRSIVLSVLAAVLILSLSVGSALAYFTTFTTVDGNAPFKAGNITRIDESYEGNVKSVWITNLSSSKESVFIRARVFSAVPVSVSGTEKWSQHGEYWYFSDAVPPGGVTDVLNVTINFKSGFDPEDYVGEKISVIVVYEAIFAPQFDEDGNELAPWDGSFNWAQKVLEDKN